MPCGFRFLSVLENWHAVLEGPSVTFELSAGATALGLGIAVPSALAEVHGPAPFRWLVDLPFDVGAWATEIIRAGIEAVAKGRSEARTALGSARLQTFRSGVLPRAARIEGTPLASTIGGASRRAQRAQPPVAPRQGQLRSADERPDSP